MKVPALSLRRRLLAVFCGGFCGTLTRYALSLLLQGWLGKGWPYDILLINLSGAFVLAALSTLADASFVVGPTARLLLNTGFLGAYTTFSSLALGDILLVSRGQFGAAILYLVLSVGLGLCAAVAGVGLGRWCLRFRRGAPGLASDHLDVEDDILSSEMVSEQEP